MFGEEIQLSDKRQFLEWRKQPMLAVTSLSLQQGGHRAHRGAITHPGAGPTLRAGADWRGGVEEGKGSL